MLSTANFLCNDKQLGSSGATNHGQQPLVCVFVQADISSLKRKPMVSVLMKSARWLKTRVAHFKSP